MSGRKNSTRKGTIRNRYIKGSFLNGTRRRTIPTGNALPDLEVKTFKQVLKENPRLRKMLKQTAQASKPVILSRESRTSTRKATLAAKAQEKAREEAIKKAMQDEQRKAKATLTRARREKKEAEAAAREAEERVRAAKIQQNEANELEARIAAIEAQAAAIHAKAAALESQAATIREREAEKANDEMGRLANTYSRLHIGAPFLSTGRAHPWQKRGLTTIREGGARTRRHKK